MLSQLKAVKIRPENQKDFLHYLCLSIILAGIALRLVQYFSNRSLWGDEAYLALNLVNRSYFELLQPLDYNQAAPPGFLWVEKLAIQLFGNSEYSMRLFPLIAGIIALIAFYQFGKWAVSAIALPIALALFAFLKYPTYYSTEVKQYSSDLMVALLLCLLLIPLYNQIISKRRSLLLGLLGICAIWFSHPAIFVLIGLELAHLVTIPAKNRKAILINRLPVYLLWAVGFGSLYFLTLARAMKNEFLQTAWGGEYPDSVFNVIWLLDSLGRVFYRPLGFFGKTDGIAIAAFIIGCIAFWRKKRDKFLILIAPIAVTLVAAYLHKYPFRSRLILFLVPFFLVILAGGIAYLLSQVNQRRNYGAIAGAVMTCLLLFPPLLNSGKLLIQPHTVHEIRPVIEYIKNHQKPGDGLYVDSGILPFEYYAPKYGYSKSDYVPCYNDCLSLETFSVQDWESFKRQSDHLRDKQRVWFLFSGDAIDETFVKPNLNRIGQQIDHFRQPGAFTYLYQLK